MKNIILAASFLLACGLGHPVAAKDMMSPTAGAASGTQGSETDAEVCDRATHSPTGFGICMEYSQRTDLSSGVLFACSQHTWTAGIFKRCMDIAIADKLSGGQVRKCGDLTKTSWGFGICLVRIGHAEVTLEEAQACYEESRFVNNLKFEFLFVKSSFENCMDQSKIPGVTHVKIRACGINTKIERTFGRCLARSPNVSADQIQACGQGKTPVIGCLDDEISRSRLDSQFEDGVAVDSVD